MSVFIVLVTFTGILAFHIFWKLRHPKLWKKLPKLNVKFNIPNVNNLSMNILINFLNLCLRINHILIMKLHVWLFLHTVNRNVLAIMNVKYITVVQEVFTSIQPRKHSLKESPTRELHIQTCQCYCTSSSNTLTTLSSPNEQISNALISVIVIPRWRIHYLQYIVSSGAVARSTLERPSRDWRRDWRNTGMPVRGGWWRSRL